MIGQLDAAIADVGWGDSVVVPDALFRDYAAGLKWHYETASLPKPNRLYRGHPVIPKSAQLRDTPTSD